MATLTVESENREIIIEHDSSIAKDKAAIFIYESDMAFIKHTDIDSLIETLQRYKERMTKVLGADALK